MAHVAIDEPPWRMWRTFVEGVEGERVGSLKAAQRLVSTKLMRRRWVTFTIESPMPSPWKQRASGLWVPPDSEE